MKKLNEFRGHLMTRKKLLAIERCKDCLYCISIYIDSIVRMGPVFRCQHPNLSWKHEEKDPLKSLKVDNFPEWCPLEDELFESLDEFKKKYFIKQYLEELEAELMKDPEKFGVYIVKKIFDDIRKEFE